MTREQWLIEAKFLFHTNMPNAASTWIDEIVEALWAEFGDLEPDEAVALYLALQTGPQDNRGGAVASFGSGAAAH